MTGQGRSIERSSGIRPHDSPRGQASVVFANGARVGGHIRGGPPVNKLETSPPAAIVAGRGRSIERSSGVRPHESQRGQASVVFAHGAREIRSTNRMSFIGLASISVISKQEGKAERRCDVVRHDFWRRPALQYASTVGRKCLMTRN